MKVLLPQSPKTKKDEGEGIAISSFLIGGIITFLAMLILGGTGVYISKTWTTTSTSMASTHETIVPHVVSVTNVPQVVYNLDETPKTPEKKNFTTIHVGMKEQGLQKLSYDWPPLEGTTWLANFTRTNGTDGTLTLEEFSLIFKRRNEDGEFIIKVNKSDPANLPLPVVKNALRFYPFVLPGSGPTTHYTINHRV